MMRLKFAAALLAAPLAVFALSAMSFRGDQFSINFPDGWTTPEKADGGLNVVKSPDGSVNCNASRASIPDYVGKTLAELNTEIPGMTREDWAAHLDIPVDQIVVTNDEKRHIGDHWLHVATFTLGAGGVVPQPTTVRYGMMAVPGSIFMVGCYAATPSFGAWFDTFEATVSSLRPL